MNKPATQPNPGHDPDHEASKAVDGNLNTFYSSGWFDNPWWRLDLGSDVQIEYMIFRGHKRAVNEKRYKDMVVRGKSAIGAHFQICKNIGNLNQVILSFSCDSNDKFRYIKIEISGSSTFLFINEFEVYVKQK